MVIDRPQRRIVFDGTGAPMLVTRSARLSGEPIEEPWTFAISRHMADATNPYGIALLSVCWYWHLFKSGGGRQLVKLCERHGLPWPVGRYTQGMSDADQDKFEAALAEMLEAGYILAPEGSSLELLTPHFSGGELPQEVLIRRCNTEMSKALTGQSQMAELSTVGSRASADVAADRNASIADSDRDIAAQTFNRILRWITLFNIGDGVAPPTLEFYRHTVAGKDRAETYQVAVQVGARPSRAAMLTELGIPAAADDADALLPPGATARPQPPAAFSAQNLPNLPIYSFAAGAGLSDDDMVDLASQAADAVIEDKWIAPIAQMLADFEASGRTLEDAVTHLTEITGAMDAAELNDILRRAMTWSIATGATKPPLED
jgi:phage gp29-like protein